MITVDVALRLREAGLGWDPVAGDRFVVADRRMDDEVFMVSDMTVEVMRLPQGQVIGFNGTTEWALDSVSDREAVWLPRESQLRERLGGSFKALRHADGEFHVEVEVDGAAVSIEGPDAEQGYAAALLLVLRSQADRAGPATT